MRNWNLGSAIHYALEKIVFTLPMRNWNFSFPCWPGLERRFLPYLWGIEIKNICLCRHSCCSQFLPYLWGIEICFIFSLQSPSYAFLPYLWGIEINFALRGRGQPPRFYPTYEELKYTSLASISASKHAFLPYLWGIESLYVVISISYTVISFYPTYEELKGLFQAGNVVYQVRFYPTYEELKE